MFSKSLLVFLSTCLLVQSSFGKAISSSEESTDNTDFTTLQTDIEDDDETETPKHTLLFYIMAELSKVADSTLINGTKLLEDVIAEISVLNEQMTAKLEEYSKLVNKLKKVQSEEDSDVYETVQLLVDFIELLDKSNVTLIEEPTSIDKLFEESLVKNGMPDVDDQAEKKFMEVFSKEFYGTANRILNSFKTEEWSDKTKLKDWLKKFNIEDNVEMKGVLLQEFFDFF